MGKYTKEILEKAIEGKISLAMVLEELNLTKSGGNYTHIKNRLAFYNISTDHFLGQRSFLGKIPKSKRTLEEFKKDVLCKNGTYIKSHALKLKLYEFNLKKECCEVCNLGNMWNGARISLHLDHIDGTPTNNELTNLRILCPNCHSQTSTYAGKRNKSKLSKEDKLHKINNHCLDCDTLIGKRAARCKICKATKQANENRTFIIPDKETLFIMLKQTNFTKVAEKYNISGNAVRKWCLKYGLSTKSSDYK